MIKFEDERAFPVTMYNADGSTVTNLGMTLRDYFAVKVDISIYTPFEDLKASYGRVPIVGEMAEYITAIRYIEADAMLAERVKPSVDEVVSMTVEQYRCLIGHMKHWQLGIEYAIRDVGITLTKENVVHELFKAGWNYNDVTDTIEYEDDAK